MHERQKNSQEIIYSRSVGFRSERTTICQTGLSSSRLTQKGVALLADDGGLGVAEHSCAAWETDAQSCVRLYQEHAKSGRVILEKQRRSNRTYYSIIHSYVNIVRDVSNAMNDDSHLVAARASNIHKKTVRALNKATKFVFLGFCRRRRL